MNRTVACLLIAVALAGCAGGPERPDEPADGIKDATGKTVANDAPANETVKTDSGKQVAVNKALVHGRVHDDFNFSLHGAFVTVVGTTHFAETDRTGHYVIENVTVGTFDLRFEMDQFKVREERVTLRAGQEMRLDVQLLPLVERSGGFNPHVHDHWGADTTRVLMDHSFPVNQEFDVLASIKGRMPGIMGGIQCGARTCSYPFMLPDQEDGAPASIWPATKEMRVTLGWSGATMRVAAMRLDYADPTMSSLDRIESAPVPNGGTIVIPVTPEMQDHGHARWSGWRFNAVTINEPTDAGIVYGDIRVKIEIVKGEVVLDPPHEDFWKGRTSYTWSFTRLPNVGVLPTDASSTGLNHVYGLPNCPSGEHEDPECLDIVPPGTERMEILFKWHPNAQGQRAPFDYSLTYRSGDQNPHTTPPEEFKRPTVIEQNLAEDWRRYELLLAPEEADSFYMERSDWLFKWHQDTGLPYLILQGQFRLEFQITAFKAS